ncbi:MAG: hypothetical protein HOP10_02215 [Chitinophagaceae bacterium]|nr:hypothetical protein [Chitinophagaceae bacterium]
MKFLFHTIIHFNSNPVYYNIYSCANGGYFAEILDNPSKIIEAKNFRLERVNQNWCSSERIPERICDEVGEEILSHSCHSSKLS